MNQETLTIVAEIAEGQLAALRSLLGTIDHQLRSQAVGSGAGHPLPLHRIETLHFARFVIIEDHFERPPLPPLLVFATDFDGPRKDHLDTLNRVLGSELAAVLSHCQGFAAAGGRARLVAWLRAHAVEPIATYRGHPARSVRDIRCEAALRRHVEQVIATLPVHLGCDVQGECAKTLDVRALRNEVAALPPLRLSLLRKSLLVAHFLPRHLGKALGAVARAPALRRLEDADAASFRATERNLNLSWRDVSAVSLRNQTALAHDEDRGPQNQLTSVTELKPGPLRRRVLELVLAFIDLAARIWFDRGTLGGISSIHFARWLILDDAKTGRARLVFLSDYDGSWETYLGDFIDRASLGLTAIWSNTKHFPPARWLVKEGSRHERHFKEFVRWHQIGTPVWYSAYPDLSVQDVSHNSALRRGLLACGSWKERERWLASL